MADGEDREDTKRCVVCGGEFKREDFPNCFDKMVTCGNISCAGKRRYMKWKERYEKYKDNKK